MPDGISRTAMEAHQMLALRFANLYTIPRRNTQGCKRSYGRSGAPPWKRPGARDFLQFLVSVGWQDRSAWLETLASTTGGLDPTDRPR